MIFNKSRIVINIEPNILRHKIVKPKTHLNVSDHKGQGEYYYQSPDEIEQFVAKLQNQYPKQSKYELNLSESYVQSQTLTLPDVKLSSNELALYIEASMYKLFGRSAKELFFDFVYFRRPKNSVQVTVCERSDVNYWIDLFDKNELNLVFIGYVNDNLRFNFLPWRQTKLSRHKFQLTMMTVCLIGVLICQFIYWWINAQTQLNDYEAKLSKQQLIKQQYLAELSTYIPNPSPSQRQIKQSLLTLSEKLPDMVWLNSYQYVPQNIAITGHSLSYIEIIHFNQVLLQLKNISKSQIITLTNHEDMLSFEMDIKLNDE